MPQGSQCTLFKMNRDDRSHELVEQIKLRSLSYWTLLQLTIPLGTLLVKREDYNILIILGEHLLQETDQSVVDQGLAALCHAIQENALANAPNDLAIQLLGIGIDLLSETVRAFMHL